VERIGACGRGEQATHSGGVGAPSGGQYGLPARSWLTEAVHVRTATKSAARRRRRTPDGAPEGATPSQEGVHIKDCRATWRAVPSLLSKGGHYRKTRAHPRRENDAAWPKTAARFPENEIKLPTRMNCPRKGNE